MTTETSDRSTAIGAAAPSYTVTMIHGCRVVSGQVPLRDIAILCNGFSKKAVMALDLANYMGAAYVIGEPDDIERLRADRDSLPISEARRHDAAVATACGLPPVVVIWLRKGERGASSEALCQAIFGVPGGDPRSTHPHDPDDLRRCLVFLAATDRTDVALWGAKVSQLSPHWAALVAHWEELLDSYQAELAAAPTSAGSNLAMPETYALMRTFLDAVNG